MHQKRVTCELHDSYYCLMTIKHAIAKTEEVTHSDGQLWGDIGWAIELLYNSMKTGSQLVWRPDQFWRQDVVEKASTQLRAGPRAFGWAALESRKETLMSIRVGRSICCSSVRSPTPSHTQTFQIKWEVYFSKNCVVVFIVSSLWFCMYMHMCLVCNRMTKAQWIDLFLIKAGLQYPTGRWIWKSLLWVLLFKRCYHFAFRNLLVLAFKSEYRILNMLGVRSLADLAAETGFSFPLTLKWIRI